VLIRLRRWRSAPRAEQCRGCARFQFRTLMQTRRVEWEHQTRSYVAEVFEPACLGVLAWHQVYITIIRSNIDDLQMKRRKNGAYAPILLRNKNETLCPSLRASTNRWVKSKQKARWYLVSYRERAISGLTRSAWCWSNIAPYLICNWKSRHVPLFFCITRTGVISVTMIATSPRHTCRHWSRSAVVTALGFSSVLGRGDVLGVLMFRIASPTKLWRSHSTPYHLSARLLPIFPPVRSQGRGVHWCSSFKSPASRRSRSSVRHTFTVQVRFLTAE
jgi:hypothetical protein